jgi:hypothetical protein
VDPLSDGIRAEFFSDEEECLGDGLMRDDSPVMVANQRYSTGWHVSTDLSFFDSQVIPKVG